MSDLRLAAIGIGDALCPHGLVGGCDKCRIDTRDERIKELTAENAKLRQDNNAFECLFYKHHPHIEADDYIPQTMLRLEAENAALREKVERLRGYSAHKFFCSAILNSENLGCDCGFDTLTSLKEGE